MNDIVDVDDDIDDDDDDEVIYYLNDYCSVVDNDYYYDNTLNYTCVTFFFVLCIEKWQTLMDRMYSQKYHEMLAETVLTLLNIKLERNKQFNTFIYLSTNKNNNYLLGLIVALR